MQPHEQPYNRKTKMESKEVVRTSVSSECRSSMDSNKENKLTVVQYQQIISKCKENHNDNQKAQIRVPFQDITQQPNQFRRTVARKFNEIDNEQQMKQIRKLR